MADLIKWCEDWAKARDYWVENSAHRRKGWCVRAIDAAHLPPGFQVCLGGDDGFDGWTSLTPLQFWLWAHAVDTGRTDSQRCETCECGGHAFVEPEGLSAAESNAWLLLTRATTWTASSWVTGEGFVHVDTVTRRHLARILRRHPNALERVRHRLDPYEYRPTKRPCPTCTGPAAECEACEGTGEPRPYDREDDDDPGYRPDCEPCSGRGTIPGDPLGYISRPLARVVCEAMPRECPACMGRVTVGWHEPDEDGCSETVDCGACEDGMLPGDPAARVVLERHADDLQGDGALLGTALALWLHGVPCEVCSGACEVEVPANEAGMLRLPDVCEACHGDGTALGAYVAAQLEAERLDKWRADCDDLELETMEDLAADFLDALAP